MPSATVLVRYWAAVRAATGVDAERVTLTEGPGEGQREGQGKGSAPAPATLGWVLDEVTARHTELGRVLRVATVLVDGRAADRARPLADGDVIEVLPPFAGG